MSGCLEAARNGRLCEGYDEQKGRIAELEAEVALLIAANAVRAAAEDGLRKENERLNQQLAVAREAINSAIKEQETASICSSFSDIEAHHDRALMLLREALEGINNLEGT